MYASTGPFGMQTCLRPSTVSDCMPCRDPKITVPSTPASTPQSRTLPTGTTSTTRLQVAIELLGGPAVVIVNEPTTPALQLDHDQSALECKWE